MYWSISSDPESNSSSNSSAVMVFGCALALVLRSFFFSRAADRDDADCFFMAMCHRCRPECLSNSTDDRDARLCHEPRRQLDSVRVAPDRLIIHDIDPLL